MEQFTKDLTKTLLSNGDVKELFRQQLEKAINQILQAELTSLLGYDPLKVESTQIALGPCTRTVSS